MSAQRPTLRRKLFLARKAAEAVGKNGYSTEGDFTFAQFEDVLAEASKQLEKRDIFYLPSMVDEELVIGKQGVIAKAVIEYEVTDTKTGESLKVRWAGTGHDSPGDKALFKATTGTEKYFLARLLGIPFGTDPEADAGPATNDLSAEADHIRAEQDAAAEKPDLPPVPESDLPEVDWEEEEASLVQA
jgi:ERF superfamily protein